MTMKWRPEEVKMLEQMAHAGMSIPDMLRVFKSRTAYQTITDNKLKF